MKLVYLAGPISGLDYAGAVDWRIATKRKLAESGITGLSPMRGKEYLSHVKQFSVDGDAYKSLSVLSSNRGIMTRDRWDVMRCDVLLANLLGATKPSIGTIMEIAWADAKRIPIVGVMEAQGNPHDHGMILEALGFRVETLDEAVKIVEAILA